MSLDPAHDATSWLTGGGPGRSLTPAAGETIFRQGDPASAVFLVTRGRVQLRRQLEDGSAVVLHTARAGETFAEAAVSASTYHCDAVSETAASLVRYDVERLRGRLAADPAAAFVFSMYLAGQVRDLRSRLELRNIRSARDRTIAWLKLRARGTPPVVQTERPWTVIAEEIGLSREALYRALVELSRSGAIRREPDRTVLLRP